MADAEVKEGWVAGMAVAFFNGTNQFAQECKLCGYIVPAGKGELFKVGKRWIVDHPDCSGLRPFQMHRGGWLYAFTHVGQQRDMIKLGMTSGSITDRVTHKFVSGNLMTKPFKIIDVKVWICPTQDRYASESVAHKSLKAVMASPSDGLGREVFRAPLSVVIEVMEAATGGSPRQLDWDFSGKYLSLKDDPIEPIHMDVPLR